jgi:hypothetical protein
MWTAQAEILTSLRSTQTFLDEHAEALDGLAHSGTRRRLDAAVAALADDVADQAGSALEAQSETQRVHALRRALVRDHLLPLARIARASALTMPELAPFRIPRGKPSVERLAAAARGMAEAAAPYAAVFIDAGLREGFGDRLIAAAEAMIAAVGVRSGHRSRRAGATAGIRSALSAGRRAVRVLDALIASAWADEPWRLAAWRSATHVRRTPARGRARELAGGIVLTVAPAAEERPKYQSAVDEWNSGQLTKLLSTYRTAVNVPNCRQRTEPRSTQKTTADVPNVGALFSTSEFRPPLHTLTAVR